LRIAPVLFLIGPFLVGLVMSSVSQAQSIDFSGDEKAYLATKTSITMCVDPAWMPYESINENGEHIGLAADFMALISAKIGMPIELVSSKTWSESLEYARARKCDILSLLNKTPERSEYLNFTDSYLDATVVLVAREDVVYLDGFNAVSGQTLGVVKGYVYESHIRSNYPDVRLVYVDNLDDALRRVSKGELFAAVDSLLIATHHMQALGLSNLKIAGQTDFVHELRVGVRNDDAQLLLIMQKALDAVTQVERNEIFQRWFTVRFEHGTDYMILWQVLGGGALLFVFMLYRSFMQNRFNHKLKAKNAELEYLSQTDPLTGVYNRLKTDALLDQEFERSRRYSRSLSVVMFDLDFFKQVNDTFGHQAGDRVLVAASALVQANIRKHDVLGRWGGEEFLILCPETDLQGAERLAENLRQQMEALDLGEVGTITASFGIAQLGRTEDVKRLIGYADSALYEAKQKGRNQVCIYTPLVS